MRFPLNHGLSKPLISGNVVNLSTKGMQSRSAHFYGGLTNNHGETSCRPDTRSHRGPARCLRVILPRLPRTECPSRRHSFCSAPVWLGCTHHDAVPHEKCSQVSKSRCDWGTDALDCGLGAVTYQQVVLPQTTIETQPSTVEAARKAAGTISSATESRVYVRDWRDPDLAELCDSGRNAPGSKSASSICRGRQCVHISIWGR